MNAAFIFFVLLMLACAVLALASFFTTRFTPFKQKTKLKSFGFWLGMALVCVVVAGSLAPPQPKEKVAQASSPAAPVTAEPAKEDSPEERAAARARIAEKTAAAQAEVKVLYDELLAMRGTTAFTELGFSTKNQQATAWKTRVETLRDRMEKDWDIAGEVRAAPAYLLGLGLDKTWRSGGITDKSKWDAQMVQDALNWKLPE